MSSQASNAPGKVRLWAGRVVSALPVLVLLAGATMALTRAPQLVEQLVGKFGYPESAILPIGVVELLCAILYAIPQTSVLGAVLMTGYLGAATATHVRIGENFAGPVVLGMLAWVGLYLRDERLGALLPVRRPRA